MSSSSLRSLLRRAFSAEELRRFIAEHTAEDADIAAALPAAGASLDTLIDAMLETLERRSLLDVGFFTHLATTRPNLAAEFQAIAQSRGLQPLAPLEIASLLWNQRDATVERKLVELGRTLAATPADRHELNLAVADLTRWHQDIRTGPDEFATRRDAIIGRLAALTGSIATRGQGAIHDAAKGGAHPDALSLRDAIEAQVRRADGERAVQRLLDLAERFAPDRSSHRTAVMISAQVRAWRAAHTGRAKVDPNERHEWVELLRRILELTEHIVDSTIASTADATGTNSSVSTQLTEPDLRASPELRTQGAIVTCKALSKRYSKLSRFVLRDISLTIFPRTIVGVIGPNGAGKSTLMRIISGELARSDGTLWYPQLDPGSTPTRQIDWPRVRAQIAYLPQRLPVWHGRLADNLHAWAGVSGLVGRDNADVVEFYLERLGLSAYRHATWTEISGGYQTRFALARALVGRPRLLVLDEPLAALDVRSQQRFLQDLRDIVSSSPQQQSVLVSSQHIPELEAVADEMVGLREDGGVWFHGSTDDLERTRTESCYELGGRLNEAIRDRLTAIFGPGALRQREIAALLCTGRDVPRSQLLAILGAEDDPPTSVRDISSSLTRMFWKDD